MQHILNYQDWVNESLEEWQLVTESWGEWISTALHLVGDVSAAIADVVVPGSGAVIDAINALSYFIEAQFQSDESRKTMLMMSGIIQIVAIFAVGPLQAITVNLKLEVEALFTAMKNSNMLAAATKAPLVAAGVKKIIESLSSIISVVRGKLGPGSSLAKVAKWISEKTGIADAAKWFNDFLLNSVQPVLKKFLEKITVLNPTKVGTISGTTLGAAGTQEAQEFVAKNIAKAAAKGYVNNQASNSLLSQIRADNKFWYDSYQDSNRKAAPADNTRVATQTFQRPLPSSQPAQLNWVKPKGPSSN
jgi:hypothetical protein